MNCEIAARTIRDPGKERNGDGFAHVVAAEGGAVLAMLADGVGSCPCDWLASRTACDRFVALAKSAPAIATDPADSLRQILEQIDRDIHATTGRGRGMKCAAVAVLWLPDSDRAWFVNVGDTRIYRFVDPQLLQISDDDSQAVVRRGSDGKPLLSGGAAVVQRGITNALGSGHARIAARPFSLTAGGAAVLCSDGFHECSHEFVPEITRVLWHADLDDALAVLCENYVGRNRDDATAVILRRKYPALSDAQLEQAMAGSADHPRHAVVAAIGEHLGKAVANRDEDQVRVFLDYLDGNGVVIGKARVESTLKQMNAICWRDPHSFQLLVEMLRQQS